jgi:hypothetical protein
MRLIDADKLRAQFTEPADWLDINQTLVHKTGIWAEIDNAETVEAIPVDWLLRKADWCDKNNGIFVSGAIRSAVDAWREEQKGN